MHDVLHAVDHEGTSGLRRSLDTLEAQEFRPVQERIRSMNVSNDAAGSRVSCERHGPDARVVAVDVMPAGAVSMPMIMVVIMLLLHNV